MSQVLIVSDVARTRRGLSRAATDAGHETVTARSVDSAIRHPRSAAIAAAILDLGQLDVVLAVRSFTERAHVPLITVSDRGPDAHVAALDAGAEDHLDLPVEPAVLAARLRRIEKLRFPGAPAGDVVVTDDFLLDLAGRHAVRGGAEVHLTPHEWSIVDVLVRNQGRLVPQEGVLASVWGPSKSGQANYLRVFMHSLRRKLEPDASHPRYFRTIPGVGLRFDPVPQT